MKIYFKFLLNYILRLFDLEIVSRDRQKIAYSFDFDYQKFFGSLKNITIFDIGANKGQSVNRFKSLFINSMIHSFEPDLNAFNEMKSKYSNLKNVFLKMRQLEMKKNLKKLIFINIRLIILSKIKLMKIQ